MGKLGDLGPLFEAFGACEDDEEQEVVGHLLEGLSRGHKYPWLFYESGAAITQLSPKSYAALYKVLCEMEKKKVKVKEEKPATASTTVVPKKKGRVCPKSNDERLLVCGLAVDPVLLEQHKPTHNRKAPVVVRRPNTRMMPKRAPLRPRPPLLCSIDELEEEKPNERKGKEKIEADEGKD